MSRPTFYRALKELVEKGFLTAANSGRDGRYRIKC
jgi:DNA-binding IclR family transcriptional regulator